jgi:cell wall-associated NlpC family hydrolase
MAVSDQELALRLRVVNVALGLLQSGTHYYWGAPDSGLVALAANNFSTDATKRHVLAASTDGTHFCAGRCDKAEVRAQWNGSSEAALALVDAAAVLFPRYYLDGDTVNPSASAAVYGEACKNKMHFDCASFVRYCFRTVLGPAILPPGTIMKNVAAQIWPAPGGHTPLTQADVLPADILYTANGHHVGIATGSAEHTKTSPTVPSDQSIHAYYAKVGVIRTPSWGVVRRWTKWG